MQIDGTRPVVLEERYRVGEEIGRGGMSIVYEALDLRHDRPVAVKILRPEIASSLGADRFAHEIEIEAKLQHPNILPVYDSGSTDGSLWFVMPLVEGESLAEKLRREGRLSVKDALEIVCEVADALQYAHDRDIVHRDVKPSNILLSSGHALVADFGIARALSRAADDQLTASGLVVGTPVYMSPEQAGGEAVDRRSDVYSLGCVLYEMLAGEPPFRGETPRAVLTQQMVGTIPSIEASRDDLPAHVGPTIRRALAKDPNDRFDNATDLASALTGHTLPFGPAWKRRSRRRALAVVATLIAVAGAGWLALRAPSAVALDSNRILVFPVADDGLPPDDRGAGMNAALFIITALEYAEPLKWDDGWRWMVPEHRSNPGLMSPDSARTIATARRARFFVEGEFLTQRDSVTLILRLHDVPGDSVYARSLATGPLTEDIYPDLTLRAVTELLPPLVDPGRPPPDFSAIADRAPAAVASYLEGERFYRLAYFAEAQAEYSEALAQDSILAIAALKGALAAEWTHDSLAVESFLGAVEPRAAILPTRYAAFLDGVRAYNEGDADGAIAAFGAALELSPEWPEALTALGETYYHLLPTNAEDAGADARNFFEAAAAADSGFVPPLLHLAPMAMRSHELELAESLVERYRVANSSFGQGRLSMLLRCAKEGPESIDWEEAAVEQPLELFAVAREALVGAALPACADAAGSALVGRPEMSAGFEWGVFYLNQSLEMLLGNYAEVKRQLQAAEGPAQLGVPYLWVIDAIAGAPFADSAAAQDAYLRDTFGPEYEELRAPMALWVASIWNAHIGDTARLEHVRAALEEVGREAEWPRWRRRGTQFENGAAADLARLRGDTAQALQLYAVIRPTAGRYGLDWELADPLAVERLRHAELLCASGRYGQAITVASVFDLPAAVVFTPFIPASLALRQVAALGAGRLRDAATYRERLERLGRLDLVPEAGPEGVEPEHCAMAARGGAGES